jgi:hypothetical protein
MADATGGGGGAGGSGGMATGGLGGDAFGGVATAGYATAMGGDGGNAGMATGGMGGDGYGGVADGGYVSAMGGDGGAGGTAYTGAGGYAEAAGNWGSNNGDDGYVTGQSMASADAMLDMSAFNQTIVLGANVLGNSVDLSVVGGSMSSTYIGDDDMSS